MTCQFATLLNFTTISTNYYCLHDIGQHAARRGEGRGRELEHKKCKNDLEGLRNLEEIGAKSLGSQVAAGLSPYLVNSALLLRDTARVCGEGGGGLNCWNVCSFRPTLLRFSWQTATFLLCLTKEGHMKGAIVLVNDRRRQRVSCPQRQRAITAQSVYPIPPPCGRIAVIRAAACSGPSLAVRLAGGGALLE